MTVWVARAGKYGERENQSLEEGRSYIGWGELGDLSNVESKDEIQKLLENAYPDMKAGTVRNHAGQLYNYLRQTFEGDSSRDSFATALGVHG